MTTKFMTIMIFVTLLLTTLGIQSINGQAVEQTDKVRAKVLKYGVKKTVSVKLKNKTKFKGRITSIEKESFTVEDKGGTQNTFAYSEVEKVSHSSKTTWIIVGAAAAGGLAIWLLTFGRRCQNEGANVFCR